MSISSNQQKALFILFVLCIKDVYSISRFPMGRRKRYRTWYRELDKGKREAEKKCLEYAPFNKKVIVGSVEAPVAEKQNNYIKTFAGRGALTANGAMHTLNVVKALGSNISTVVTSKLGDNFAKWAPLVASSLGVFGVFFGVIVDLSTPSVQDAIDHTNQLFAKFAKEVSDRLKRMEGFVKAEITNLERRLMVEDFVAMNKELNACNEMFATDIFQCILSAFMNIRSKIEKFMKFKDIVLNQEISQAHGDIVRQFEACFSAFNNYAFTYMKTVDMIARSYECERDFYEKDKNNDCDKPPKDEPPMTKDEVYVFDEIACKNQGERDYYLRLYSKLYLDVLKQFRSYQTKGMEMIKTVHKIDLCAGTLSTDRKEIPYRGPRNDDPNDKEYEVKCGCRIDPTYIVGDCSLKYYQKKGENNDGYFGNQRYNWIQICEASLLSIARKYHDNIEKKITDTWEKNLVDLSEETWACAVRHRQKILDKLDDVAKMKEKKSDEESSGAEEDESTKDEQ